MSFAICQSAIDRFEAAFMLDTFKVQEFTTVSDGSGGQTESWVDETTGVPGHMEGSKEWSREILTAQHQQAVRRWTITLKKGTSVDEARRIVQTHQNGTAITPRTFKILGVIAEQTFDAGVICECSEIPNLT